MVNTITDFSAQVHDALDRRFSGAKIHVSRFSEGDRLNGYIIWSGFDEVEQLDRQRRVYAALREELQADAAKISIILAYSPDEWEAMHEE